jgi:hypothetical protein
MFFQTYCLMALANVLSVLRFTTSDYHFGIFRMFSLYCLPFDLRLLITPFVSSNYWPLYCLSFDLRLLMTRFVSLNYWPLYCLSLDLRLLITTLSSSNYWPLYYLSMDLRPLMTSFVTLNYWPMYCLSLDLRLLMTPFVSSNHLFIVLSVLGFTTCDYHFGIFQSVAIALSPLIYAFWLFPWYLQTWPLHCLSFDLRLQITLLTSSNLWPLHYLSLMPVRGVVLYVVIGYIVNHYCLMFVREVAPYIVIGYIVNHYCLMFVREVAPYIVIGYIVNHYCLTEEPVLCCCCWLYCQPLLFIILQTRSITCCSRWYCWLLQVTWDIVGIEWVSDCCLTTTQQICS